MPVGDFALVASSALQLILVQRSACIMSDRACPRLLGSPVSHFGRGLCPRGSASTPEAEPCKDAAPGVFQIYIDEIYTDLSESSGGRQVFLIGLQEHMGSDLVDWLKDFGTILDLSRIQAPAVDIAGKVMLCTSLSRCTRRRSLFFVP